MNKVLTLILLILLAGVISFYISLWICYGNMPAEEVPAWVWWFMIGR